MRPSDSPEQDAAAAAEVKRAEFAQFALENLFDDFSRRDICHGRRRHHP